MSAQMTDAMKSAKTIQTEMVQWENRLELLKQELGRTQKAKDDLDALIEHKTSEYQLFMAQKDADTKRMRDEVHQQSSQLAKEKADFQSILLSFQKEKQAAEASKSSMDVEKSKLEAQQNNIKQFIISVQRSLGLLGL